MLIQNIKDLPKPSSLPDIIAFDTEQNPDNNPQGLSIAWREYYINAEGKIMAKYKGLYVPVGHRYPVGSKLFNLPFKQVRDWIEQVLKSRRVVMHNAEYDLDILERKYNIILPLKQVEDTILAHWVLDTNRLHALKEIRKTEYGRDHLVTFKQATKAGIKRFVEYAEDDSIETLMLYYDLMKQFKPHPKTYNLYKNVEIPFIECTKYINKDNNMIRIDRELLGGYVDLVTEEVEIALQTASDVFAKKLGEDYRDINVMSNKQLGEALHKLKFPLKVKQDTGNFILGEKELNQLYGKRKDLILALILYIRTKSKLNNTYVTKLYELLEEIDKNTWVLAGYRFNHTGTETGRMCVSGDTILNTDNGSLCISNLDLTQGKKFRILTHTIMPQVIKNLYYKGKEEMYEVKTESGKTIKCTKGHRFLTVQGWKKLGALNEGEKVYTYDYSNESTFGWAKSYFRREVVCTPCTAINFNSKGIGKEIQNQRTHISNLDEALQNQIPDRSKAQTKTYLCKFKMGKQVWQTQTRSIIEQTDIRRFIRKGLFYISNSTKNEYIRMVCKTKYRLVQITSSRERCFSVNRAQQRLSEKLRTFFQWFNKFNADVQQRTNTFFQSLVYSFWKFNAVDLVCTENSGEIRLLQREKSNTKKSYLLEHEQGRVNIVDELTTKEDTTCAPILYSQTLYSGFLFPAEQSTCRDRWGFSSKGFENSTIRQGERKNSQANEIQTNSFHRQGSYKRCAESDNFIEEKIISVVSVGVQDVWDIEVENDHSYLAQGFVNHNSSADPNMQNMPRDKILLRFLFYKEAEKYLSKKYLFIDDDTEKEIHKWAVIDEKKDNANSKFRKKKINDLIYKYSIDIRAIFIPFAGNVFIGADYSQIELRMPAHLANDEVLIKQFADNIDIHQQTTDDVNSLLGGSYVTRQDAKPVNFGILYGLFESTFSRTSGMPINLVYRFFEAWWKSKPKIKALVDTIHQTGRKSHFVQTILGRRRNVHKLGINSEDKWIRGHAANAAVSTVISGSSADLIKLAMLRLIKYKELIELKLQIHDELLFEVPKKYAVKYQKIIKDEMEQAMKLRVPVVAEAKIGTSWRDCH